jgi:putative flippase GtrA
MTTVKTSPSSRLPLLTQLVKFGAVGGVGFFVNLVVFNLLLATVFHPASLHYGPLYATVAATLVAIVVNWLGNRYWAFAAGRQSNTAREGAEFFAVSLIGMGIPLLCVWVSHYMMHFTSPLADNIANNVVGLGLGMLFRFALYRWWVFAPRREATAPVVDDAAALSAVE